MSREIVARLRAVAAGVTWKPLRTLLGLFIAGFLTYGIGVYGFLQILPSIERESGWGRAMIGGTMTAFWLAAPFIFIARRLLNAVGLRVVVIAGAACEAIALALMAVLSSPVEMYVLRFLMGVGKIFIATPIPIAIARMFRRRAGLAVAVALTGWHVGGVVFAPVAANLITAYGWRRAAAILAVVLAVVMVGAALLMSEWPPSTASAVLENRPKRTGARTTTSAFRNGTALAAGTIAFYSGYAGLLSHLTPLLTDRGFALSSVARATGSTALCAVVGVIVGGVTTQIVAPRIAGALALVLIATVELSAASLTAGSGTGVLTGLVVLLGLLIGAGDPIVIEALRRSVPAERFDRVYVWWYLLLLVTLAIAPLVTGEVYDQFGSYRPAFITMGIASLIVAAFWWLLFREHKVRPSPINTPA